jgi:hypothetical protein
VLNACEGARSDDPSDPFAGMAQSLIRQGLPAVVAMQFEITDDAAIIFAQELYGAIADGYPLEAALAGARGAIRDDGNLTEWGTPVLYSRAPDGHLFDVTRQAREDATHQGPEQGKWAKQEAEEKARQEAERQEAEEKARQEAERQEAEEKARQEAERKARQEAERKARQEAERKARQEAEEKARQEAERKARQEAEEKARQETERKARRVPEMQKLMRQHAAGDRWQAVLDVSAEIAKQAPAAADPWGLVTKARRQLGYRSDRTAEAEELARLAAEQQTQREAEKRALKARLARAGIVEEELLSEMAAQIRVDETLMIVASAWVSAPRHLLAGYTQLADAKYIHGLLVLTDRRLVFVAKPTWGAECWTLTIPYGMIDEAFDPKVSGYILTGIRTSAGLLPKGAVRLILKKGEGVEFRTTADSEILTLVRRRLRTE